MERRGAQSVGETMAVTNVKEKKRVKNPNSKRSE
jgi:hypothetical protein